MKPYEFKVSDISSPSAEVIYISHEEGRRTFGRSYPVMLFMRDKDMPYAIVGCDDGYRTSIQLDAMAGSFIPTTAMSDKELFLFKISGRLPEWVTQ